MAVAAAAAVGQLQAFTARSPLHMLKTHAMLAVCSLLCCLRLRWTARPERHAVKLPGSVFGSSTPCVQSVFGACAYACVSPLHLLLLVLLFPAVWQAGAHRSVW